MYEVEVVAVSSMFAPAVAVVDTAGPPASGTTLLPAVCLDEGSDAVDNDGQFWKLLSGAGAEVGFGGDEVWW